MNEELTQELIKEDPLDQDPIGIEARIKELEHAEYLLMEQVYPLRHEIQQQKHNLSIARAKYWRSK